tara:strand:+ start:1160 stop:1588 length:429 start_codon:yes stop_codon:yes gene_type:complete
MAIDQALCTSFKREVLEGVHDFTTHTFKIALYTSAASLGAATTAYTATEEVVGTGYTATGAALTVTGAAVSVSGATVYIDFGDVMWTTSTLTARGALIYNDTAAGDPAVAVLDFGIDRSSTAASFVVSFPTATASSAIVRLV